MLPREIRTENWPDRAVYELPRRPIGKARYLGLLLIGFAVLFAWSPGKEVLELLTKVSQGTAQTGDWLLGSFTFLFVLAALVPFAFGLFVLMGSTRVVITRDYVRVTECAGPVRWSRRIRSDSIVGLEVGFFGSTQTTVEDASHFPAGVQKLGALMARKRFGQPVIILKGYPRDWLDALGAEISEVLSSFGEKISVRSISPPLTNPMPWSEMQETSAGKPSDSGVQQVDTPEGIQLNVPSRGFWKQSQGLIVFGLFWSVVVGAIGTVMVGQGGVRGEGTVVIGLFGGIGLLMLGIGVHLGSSRWEIRAGGSGLEAARTSWLRRTRWTWQRDDILGISIGNSGISVNDRPLPALVVQPRSGKGKPLMIGRDPQELAWMAALLRNVLRIEAAPTAGDDDTKPVAGD